MTKAEIVSNISEKSGIEKADVLRAVEEFMVEVKDSLEQGNNVYLRGFGSFIIKKELKKLEEIFQRTQRLKYLLTIFLHLNLQKFLLKELKRNVSVK